MGSSTAGVTVTDDSAAAISDEDGATTDTDVDVKGDVDSSLPSDPSPFSQGEKVLAFFQNHVYPAKDPSLDPYVDFIDSLCLMQSEPFCLRFLLISRVVSSSEWGGIPLIPALDRLTLAIVTSRETGVCFLNQLLHWDEWVSMDRLMKFTEENVQKQVVLNKRKSTEKITKIGEVVFLVSCDLNTFAVARGKKRKIDSVEKEKDNLTPEKLLNILLPSTLKKQLVDDCASSGVGTQNRVDKASILAQSQPQSGASGTRNQFQSGGFKCFKCGDRVTSLRIVVRLPEVETRHFSLRRLRNKVVRMIFPFMMKKYVKKLGLVRLPRNPNVDDILKKYLDHRLKKDGAIADSIEEILNGLRCYFDKALPAMLLYKSERQQYQDATADHVSPSTVYGAEHLLRLFVKLPEMLYFANIEEETLKELQQKLLDFLKYNFFHSSDYSL
ncbi:hypothetical protein RHGRI_016354 [Rhododendron griersonianum]|uniref:MRG domain-containing protein n=1 Tax=Rhododendron griersonianum TaxID=479676 RepID=A0AAV6JTU0_9ERIC|nr:hypothetical protein RHGRI_016354 [Rhododendron griersonianum]